MKGVRSDITEVVLAFGEAYQKTISDNIIQYWNQVLNDISPVELTRAVKTYLTGPECKFFPQPGQIYALAKPDDTKEEAVILAAKIIGAISKFGPYRVTDVKEYLGELGWEVVTLRGGWQNLCELDYEQLPAAQAQLRELIKSVKTQNKKYSLQSKKIEATQELRRLAQCFNSLSMPT